MSFAQGFTVSGNNTTPSTFTVTDTSVGSDPAIAKRLIYIFLSDNSLFTGSPIQFPLPGTSISPAILTKDFAFTIRVDWVDIGGGQLYTASQTAVFTGFLWWFFFGLTQGIAAKPWLANDDNFMKNYSNLITYIDSANNAISVTGSVVDSQNMVLLGQNLVQNQNLYF